MVEERRVSDAKAGVTEKKEMNRRLKGGFTRGGVMFLRRDRIARVFCWRSGKTGSHHSSHAALRRVSSCIPSRVRPVNGRP